MCLKVAFYELLFCEPLLRYVIALNMVKFITSLSSYNRLRTPQTGSARFGSRDVV